jgi:hypothetical protein
VNLENNIGSVRSGRCRDHFEILKSIKTISYFSRSFFRTTCYATAAENFRTSSYAATGSHVRVDTSSLGIVENLDDRLKTSQS